jgi:hypothetical protein
LTLAIDFLRRTPANDSHTLTDTVVAAMGITAPAALPVADIDGGLPHFRAFEITYALHNRSARRFTAPDTMGQPLAIVE